MQWIATKTVFDTALPHFQSKGYELLLLPLYAQFGNMYFSSLRDGVIFGSKWNWNKQYQQMVASTLTNDVTTFVQYANQTYQTKYQSIANSTGTDYHACQPFRNLNSFSRQMTLSVLDFSGNWQCFDATKYPNPVSIHLTREIYSDPIGTADDSGPINLPSPPTWGTEVKMELQKSGLDPRRWYRATPRSCCAQGLHPRGVVPRPRWDFTSSRGAPVRP